MSWSDDGRNANLARHHRQYVYAQSDGDLHRSAQSPPMDVFHSAK